MRVAEREALQVRAKEAGVPTMVHYPIPLNQQPAVENKQAKLPIGDAVAKEVLSLPMHSYLTQEEQIRIVKSIESVFV
ncbi:UDP-2-acetamido-2-deoxy-3-oxo-D-glucuronate aminotransferase [compost metagenome]